MKESVIYQDIFQKGVEIGRQEAIREGASEVVRRVFRGKLGELSPETETQINNMSLCQLELLADRFQEFSQLSDLTDWLAQND